MVRETEYKDLDALLHLYLFLHEDNTPEITGKGDMQGNVWHMRKRSRRKTIVIR